jgi:hypothetical protein
LVDRAAHGRFGFIVNNAWRTQHSPLECGKVRDWDAQSM